MNIDVTEDGIIRLKRVFNSIVLETEEGNRFAICMRDNGLEIGLVDTSIKNDGPEVYLKWFAAKDGNIKELVPMAMKDKTANPDPVITICGENN